MPILANYHHFAGRHWETGSVHNFYAYRGVKAPHTGQPYSEALFMGISGGAVMGYFTFAYTGFDPHIALLARNTFDPLNTMLARLGMVQEVIQTGKPEKAVRNLVDTWPMGYQHWSGQTCGVYPIMPCRMKRRCGSCFRSWSMAMMRTPTRFGLPIAQRCH